MEIQKEALARTLEETKRKGFDYLKCITATDYSDHLDVVYILRNMAKESEEIVTVRLETQDKQGSVASEHKAGLSINTVMHIYPAADWYERELSEMFGIHINGRDARRLLLEKWNGTEPPMRKAFQWGKPYNTQK